MPWKKIFGCLLTLLALAVVHGTALSQPELKPEEAAKQADEHFWKGKALLKAGNVRGAYEEYKTAFGLRKSYDAAANLGNLELTLGMPRDAAEHLAYALHNYAPTGTTATALERNRELLAQAAAQVAKLTIHVNVDGAEVAVDDRVIGRSPLSDDVYVNPGSRAIEARLVAYTTAHVTINADKGAAQQVTLKLEAPAPVPTATSTVAVPPPAPTRPPTGLLVGGGVLAAGGLAAGIGLTVAANANASNAASLRAGVSSSSACSGAAASTSQCSTILNDLKNRDTFTKAAFASFFVGGAFALATAGLGVWSATIKPQKDAPAIRVAPTVGQREGGIVVLGSF